MKYRVMKYAVSLMLTASTLVSMSALAFDFTVTGSLASVGVINSDTVNYASVTVNATLPEGSDCFAGIIVLGALSGTDLPVSQGMLSVANAAYSSQQWVVIDYDDSDGLCQAVDLYYLPPSP